MDIDLFCIGWGKSQWTTLREVLLVSRLRKTTLLVDFFPSKSDAFFSRTQMSSSSRHPGFLAICIHATSPKAPGVEFSVLLIRPSSGSIPPPEALSPEDVGTDTRVVPLRFLVQHHRFRRDEASNEVNRVPKRSSLCAVASTCTRISDCTLPEAWGNSHTSHVRPRLVAISPRTFLAANPFSTGLASLFPSSGIVNSSLPIRPFDVRSFAKGDSGQSSARADPQPGQAHLGRAKRQEQAKRDSEDIVYA